MKLMVTDMGESNKHKVLVEYALRFIKDSVGEELSYFIETDINDGRPLPQLTMEACEKYQAVSRSTTSP